MNFRKLHDDIHEGALQLMAENRVQLFAKARSLCGSDDEADELVVRTIDQAIRKIDTYTGTGGILSWMMTILENIHKHDHRNPVVRNTASVSADELERCAGVDWSTDEQILKNSDSEAIRKAISELDPKYNQVLLMRYYDEFSLKQIAGFLRLPVGTVSWRLHVAHRLLSGKLGVIFGRVQKPLAVLVAVLSFVFFSAAAVFTGWLGGDSGTGDSGTVILPVQPVTVSASTQNTTVTTKGKDMNIKKVAAVASGTVLGLAASTSASANVADSGANPAIVQMVSGEDVGTYVPHANGSTEVKFVDYVESTGSQYVDLGIVGRSGMRLTTRMSWVTVTGVNGGYVGVQDLNTRFFPLHRRETKWCLSYGTDNSGTTPLVAGKVYDVVSIARKGEQTLTVNGVTDIAETIEEECNARDLHLHLFAVNFYLGGKLSELYYSCARCYSLKIETNTVDGAWVTVRDLRPIAIDDGSAGALYDMVSGEIYRSATATPLVASSNPSYLFSVSRSAVSAAGEMKVFAKIDTLDGLAPCTLTAVVRDCVTGETIAKSLGVATDSELHDYDLFGLTPDGTYEITVHGSWPNLGSDGLESDLYVFQMSSAVDTAKESIHMVAPEAQLDGDPMDWLVKFSGLHRLPQDGDKVIIGAGPGIYSLVLDNVGTRTFNGWTLSSEAFVTGETTVRSGTTLNITNVVSFSANTASSKGSFVVDGGILQFTNSTTFTLYNNDSLIVKNGLFLRDGTAEDAFEMLGASCMHFRGGTVNLNGTKRGYVRFNSKDVPSPYVVQTGGDVTLGAITIQRNSDSYYEISGGSLAVPDGVRVSNNSGKSDSCATIRLRGSRFTFEAGEVGHTVMGSGRTLLPSFYDFRIRSDADPGAKGVGFIDYTGTAVKGAWRAIPDGGVAIVHTNLFPLIVQRNMTALKFSNDYLDGMASYRFWSTGLFDIGVPAGLAYMIRADLKPEAELADGWTSEEGVCAGFVKLPRVHTPAKLLKADLKLKVEPQGTKTLGSLKSDLEAMGFGPVTADETAAYNLVVGLPKDRLAKNFADSKVLMDFTTVTGAKAMQSNTVTTNALIKAVSLDIRKPGLVLMVD